MPLTSGTSSTSGAQAGGAVRRYSRAEPLLICVAKAEASPESEPEPVATAIRQTLVEWRRRRGDAAFALPHLNLVGYAGDASGASKAHLLCCTVSRAADGALRL